MWIAIVVIVLVVLLVGFGVVGFNRLRSQDVAADEALGGIDVQLTRRADLIPNLVNTVKGYATHEKGVFEAVTEARARVTKAAADGTVAEKSAAQAELDRALVNVLAVAEAYPDLKASASYLDLQRRISGLEEQIAHRREYYNAAVNLNNVRMEQFPDALLVGLAGLMRRPLFAVAGDERADVNVSALLSR